MTKTWNRVAVGLSVLGMAIGLACAGGAEDAEPTGGYDAPVTSQLTDVVVGAVGAGILFQNHTDDVLQNVEIVINESAAGGGYRFRPASIPPNSTQTYLSQVFKNADGQSLNPMENKPTQFTIYADTPRGRGAWSGGYEAQR